MKKSIFVFSLVSVVAVSGCNSYRAKMDKPTYTIAETSGKMPAWVEDNSSIGKNDKDYKYFIGEAKNVNRTLCVKGASADASEKVMAEIKQMVNSNYDANDENNNGNVNSLQKATLSKKIELALGGIKNVDSYWQLQRYQEKLGAEKDEKVYRCYQVVKIKNDTIEKTIKLVNESVENKIKNSNNQQAKKDAQ